MKKKDILFFTLLALREPTYALKKSYNLINYIINPTANIPLKNVVLYLTLNCNLKCIMCPLWGENISPENIIKNDLKIDLKTVKQLIKYTKKYSPSFLLTGGEPLLFENWKEIAKEIKKNNLHCNLQTNGTLLKKYVKEVVNLVDFLNISLDGTKDVHNQVRKKNSFTEIISGLKTVGFYKRKYHQKTPYLNICYTITRQNYFDCLNTLKFLENNFLQINEVIFTQQEFFNNSSSISKSLAKKMTKNFINLQKYKSKFRLSFRPQTRNKNIIYNYYLKNNSVSKNEFRLCPYPFYEIYVFPDGKIFSCPTEEVGDFTKIKISHIIKRLEQKHNSFIKNKKNLCINCKGEIYMYNLALSRALTEREI